MNVKALQKAVVTFVAAAIMGGASLSIAAAPVTTPAVTQAKPVSIAPVVAASPAAAPAPTTATAPATLASLPPIDTIATRAILVDVNTGAVLLEKDADGKMPTSSMSKAVSLYLIFDTLKKGQWKLTDELPVSEKAWKMAGSKMFIKVGTTVKVDELIRGVATISGNDAVVCLAEGLAGSEEDFVDRMNALTRQLGMNNSHFMNASGWPDPNHYSTPRDLAIIGEHLVNDFPEYYHFFGEKEFTYNKIRQPATDPLIGKVVGVDGIKTGHTEAAGYGLISSAQRDGRRLMLVVNGLPTAAARATESARLLEWGFRNFETKKIIAKGDEVDQAKVWLGKQESVPMVTDKDVTIVVPIAKRDGVKMSTHYNGPVEAPIRKGTVIGKLRISIPDQSPQEIDLVAGRDVERQGVFGRATSRLRYLLSGA